jgi:hypothetical protein
LTRRELDGELRGGVYLDGGVLGQCREARIFDRYLVMPGEQVGLGEVAVAVGIDVKDGATVEIGDGDFGGGESCAGAIDDGAGDVAGGGLGESKRRNEHGGEERSEQRELHEVTPYL